AFAESALFTGSLGIDFVPADGPPESVEALWVTPSLFPTLKTFPALGRAFTEEDAKLGAQNTVILSHALWRDRFGGDPGVIDTDIRINGERYTVIGIMPPGFYFPMPKFQMWLPFMFSDEAKSDSARSRGDARMIARLKPGATIAQAQREVNAIQKA